MHWGALKRMILDRGGFPAFVNNRLMHTKLIWYSNPSPDQLDVANFDQELHRPVWSFTRGQSSLY
jgi:hypothetical protein